MDDSSKFAIKFNKKEAIRRSSGGKYIDLSSENSGTLMDINPARALSPNLSSQRKL